MPQKRQSEKALRQSIKREKRNHKVYSNIKTMVKKTRKSIVAKAPETQESLAKLIKALDKALQKGLLKKNTVARKKSRLVKAFNESQSK
jgi:small subunit ribosomal protein S20